MVNHNQSPPEGVEKIERLFVGVPCLSNVLAPYFALQTSVFAIVICKPERRPNFACVFVHVGACDSTAVSNSMGLKRET